ncbi:DUF790 family protein [Sulfuracidifex metallicus]|uniref:DUF790 family protein n=1 Tax=Sulfuracidifex metallicus DSM 6482 = JCM 9184 TaxID=523847 RepID=A0A6A9QGC8_SULME|nr:DUF790 family protein [Sulfuracidifex metallicus]MUN28267.1 DUF790 family protein [Sulfuracidifex metallicus DSM 6482 = JCM 9184]
MLQYELARFKVKGEEIIPLFARPDEDAAYHVMEIFKEGKKVSEIGEEIKMLSKVYDYKLVKGLATVMLRLCVLEGKKVSSFSPTELRRFLFSKGPVIDHEERERILREASEKFKVDPIEYMYSDMKDEMIISKVPKVTPYELVSKYNLSLLQTILFKAFRMKVQIKSGWKEVIRLSKLLGLMYYAYKDNIVEFIGPMTLLKLSERYGRNLALLLPEIVKNDGWKIEAEVVVGLKKRIYKVNIEDFPFVDRKAQDTTFDSSVEENFYKDFKTVAKDWEIVREPGYLLVEDGSGRVMVPDFAVKKGKYSFYIEIVGFWTKEYLEEKVHKLKNVKEKVLILVDEELAGEKMNFPDMITFKRKVDVTKVYRWLNQNLPKPALEEIEIEGDYVKLMDIAKEQGATIKEVKSLVEKEYPEYVVLKTFAVRKSLFEAMRNEDFNGKDVQEIKKKYGEFAEEAMEFLGYKVKYKDLFNAVVCR